MDAITSLRMCAMALAGWGALLLLFVAGGRLPSFLHPDYRPLVLPAALFLLALAASLLPALRSESHATDCLRRSRVGGDFSMARLTGMMAMVLPFFCLGHLPKDDFSAQMVARRGLDTPLSPGMAQRLMADGRKSTAGASDVGAAAARRDTQDFLDLFFGKYDPLLARELAGRKMRVTGKFYQTDSPQVPLPNATNATNATGEQAADFLLVRFFMMCCAADGQPKSITVELGSQPMPLVAPMAWLEVEGSVRTLESGAVAVPVLSATSIRPVAQPVEPMISW